MCGPDVCASCGREAAFCDGADDQMPEACDECWRAAEVPHDSLRATHANGRGNTNDRWARKTWPLSPPPASVAMAGQVPCTWCGGSSPARA